MSILADQNINNLNAKVSSESEDTQQNRWVKNLGRNSSQDAEGKVGGWGGYDYSPPDLSEVILGHKWRYGPQGKMLTGGVATYEYGPKGYARLSSSNEDNSEYSSLLTSFAFMIAKDGEWADTPEASDMKQTFTSGSQMRSLWNAETGINGTPTSSGGVFTGYQADHTYGISNWFMGDEASGSLRRDATKKELGDAFTGAFDATSGRMERKANKAAAHRDLVKARGFAGGSAETVTPVVNIDTGIRNVPGMMGPKS